MFEVVFFVCLFVFSPGVVFLPREGEKTRLKAVPLCCTLPTPPGRSHRSTVATCSTSPPNGNTFNPSISCTSQWQVFVSLCMSTGMNAVWMSVFSVFFIYTAIKLGGNAWVGHQGHPVWWLCLFRPHWGQRVMQFVVKTLDSNFYCMPV